MASKRKPEKSPKETIDHDRLFKELISTFFFEFLKLFFPKVADEVDNSYIEFLDKEVFTNVKIGYRREVDLIVKLKWNGKLTFFLTLIEPQSYSETALAKRIFYYF